MGLVVAVVVVAAVADLRAVGERHATAADQATMQVRTDDPGGCGVTTSAAAVAAAAASATSATEPTGGGAATGRSASLAGSNPQPDGCTAWDSTGTTGYRDTDSAWSFGGAACGCPAAPTVAAAALKKCR